jgi:hypothetical protein
VVANGRLPYAAPITSLRGGHEIAAGVYFSVGVEQLAAHRNPAPCVIAGRRGSISVISASEQLTGDVLLIRPPIEHKVVCADVQGCDRPDFSSLQGMVSASARRAPNSGR